MNTTEGSGGKLTGRIALITGGTAGIGLATAKRFVGEGAYVFITGRREAELASAEREIGKNVRAIQGDVARLEDLDRLFAQIHQLKGRLDVIFANAGTARFGALGPSPKSSSTRCLAQTSKGFSSRYKRRFR